MVSVCKAPVLATAPAGVPKLDTPAKPEPFCTWLTLGAEALAYCAMQRTMSPTPAVSDTVTEVVDLVVSTGPVLK
jgi:hypothetical protein